MMVALSLLWPDQTVVVDCVRFVRDLAGKALNPNRVAELHRGKSVDVIVSGEVKWVAILLQHV
jgi:hypothetical protein